MLIPLFFFLPYTSIILLIVIIAILFNQRNNSGRYSLPFFIIFYVMNSFFLRFIFGLGTILSILQNIIVISLGHVVTSQLRLIGLTGQICSGKSSISDYLREQYDATIISIDDLNRKVLEMEGVQVKIRKLFGDEVFIQNEEDPSKVILNKKRIRELIYEDPKKKKRLEQITHMKVFLLFIKEILVEKVLKMKPLVVIENAILLRFLIFRLCCYKIISVCVHDHDKIIDRVIQRDQCDHVTAKNILKNQMTQEEFIKGSDFVIFNDSNMTKLKDEVDIIIRKIAL